ncbi:hypothetical protein EWM64_g1000 [Hericium alpestre]|uniref:Uncharacterized protein n=1 Tax=Hericium alpestre TaxID=135208 RepID=A0A4Z0AAL5_9AGAM|nr:hypothetical protein EWM64_g1000 [Hericium alpestre]
MIGLVALTMIAGSALSASAQSFTLSNTCQTTLASIAASTEGICINAAGLIPLSLAGANSSLVGPINSWLGGACSATACSNDTLQTFALNITSGCASDLMNFGIQPSDDDAIAAAVQQYYPLVREVACMKDNNAQSLCVTQTLNNIQASNGQLSLNGIISLVPKVASGGLGALNLSQNETCTDCLKEAYNLVSSEQPQLLSSDVNSTISGQCGADFTDGDVPGNVVQTANGLALAKNGSNAAPHMYEAGRAAALLTVLASGFVVFA